MSLTDIFAWVGPPFQHHQSYDYCRFHGRHLEYYTKQNIKFDVDTLVSCWEF